jgi:hypothetical protein
VHTVAQSVGAYSIPLLCRLIRITVEEFMYECLLPVHTILYEESTKREKSSCGNNDDDNKAYYGLLSAFGGLDDLSNMLFVTRCLHITNERSFNNA